MTRFLARGTRYIRLSMIACLLCLATIKLNADSGGFFACYGLCTVLWDCAGSVETEYDFMEDGGACIRISGCHGSEITVSKDEPWRAQIVTVSGGGVNYSDIQLYDETIYPTGFECSFSLIPAGGGGG